MKISVSSVLVRAFSLEVAMAPMKRRYLMNYVKWLKK